VQQESPAAARFGRFGFPGGKSADILKLIVTVQNPLGSLQYNPGISGKCSR
jgi:hypothetical protein